MSSIADIGSGDDNHGKPIHQPRSCTFDPLCPILTDPFAQGASEGGSAFAGDVLLGNAHVVDAVGVGICGTVR